MAVSEVFLPFLLLLYPKTQNYITKIRNCDWPKRWQRLHCSGPFGATYDSTDTRKPQSSVSDRNFDTSGPRATDTMKWGVGGRSLLGFWSRRPDRSCVTPWTRMFRDSSSSRTTLSGIPLPRFLTRSRAAILWESEGVETHTVLPIKGPQRTDNCSESVGG